MTELDARGSGQLDATRRAVAGDLVLDAMGIDLGDPALAAALGPALAGALRFDWQAGAPLLLRDVSVTGEGFALTGALDIARVDGSLDLSIGLDTRLETPQLARFSDLAGQTLQGAANLSLRGEVAPLSGAFDLVIAGQTTDLALGQPLFDPLVAGVATLDLAARRDTAGLAIDRFTIRSTAADLQGEAMLATGASVATLDATLADFNLILRDVSGPGRLSINAIQTGALWTVDADVAAPGNGTIAANARLDLPDGTPQDISADITAALGDLSAWQGAAGLPLNGDADLLVTLEGNLQDQALRLDMTGDARRLSIGQPQVDALLAGRVNMQLAATQTGDAITVEVFSLVSDAAEIKGAASGIGAEAAVDVEARVFDLAAVLDGVSGPGTLAAAAQQSGDAWDLTARLAAPGDATVVAAGRIMLPEGTARGFDATVDASLPDLAVLSGLANTTLSGRVDLTAALAGDLAAQEVDLRLDGRGAGLGLGNAIADRLLRDPVSLSLVARRAADGTVSLSEASMQSASARAGISGSVSTQTIALDYALGLQDIGIVVPELSGPVEASGTAKGGAGPFAITASVQGPGDSRAQIVGDVARDGSRVDLRADGSVPIGLANPFLTPNLATGRAQFDLALNGAPALDALSGTVSLANGQFTLPGAGLTLDNIASDIRLGGARADLTLRSDVSSGGRLAVQGTIGLRDGYPADVETDIAGFLLSRPGLLESEINGQVTVTGPLAGGALIGGALRLGATEIRIPSGAAAAGGTVEGLEHRNEPAAVRQTRVRAGLLEAGPSGNENRVPYGLDVSLDAPSRIFLRGRGLDMEFGGGLRVRGTTAAPVTEGRFELIRGRLDLLGRRLTLTEALLQLQGSLEPYLRAVATSTVDDTNIQVEIEGPASEPEVRFTSSPERPEDEVLALLLFGRDVAQLSAFQALRLANAVRVLAGGDGVAEDLRERSGLDDFDVSTDETGATGVSAGRYINENIYTDVEVDSTGKSQINLNLSVSPSVTLRGSASSEGGTGFGVFFERDY